LPATFEIWVWHENALAVDVHDAGAAEAYIAAEFCAGDLELLAK
jgi:hypothetical protein